MANYHMRFLHQNQSLKFPFLTWPRFAFLLCCMFSSAVIFLHGTSVMLSAQKSTDILLNQALLDQHADFVSSNQRSILIMNSLHDSATNDPSTATPTDQDDGNRGIRQIIDQLPAKSKRADETDRQPAKKGANINATDGFSNATGISNDSTDNSSVVLRQNKQQREPNYGQDATACNGKRIFMYEIPAEFNVGVAKECKDMVHWLDFCRHLADGGFGQKATPTKKSVEDGKNVTMDWTDWYETDPYMLEVIFHRKMEAYGCRTANPEAADAFFIPFYSGLDALRYLYGNNRSQAGEQGLSLLRWLSENYGEYWRRNGGRDHFIVMGRTAWDFTRPLDVTEGWGTSLAALPEMENVTELFLEKRPWRGNEQAIPYPTAFHPRSSSVLKAWQSRVLAEESRRFLFAFVGAPRPSSAPGDLGSLRHAALQQCLNASSVCTFLDCSKIKCAHSPIAIARRLLLSDFCLQPPGDTATRRSTFDGILSGCIPVFFRQDSAYHQYGWHFPPSPIFSAGESVEDYSVFISEDDTWRVREVLEAIPRERVAEMRRFLVRRLIPATVYAAPSASFSDAFQVSVDGVLRRAAGL